jgi:hypothetical protein
VLDWSGTNKVLATRFVEPTRLPGIVIDDLNAKQTGTWISAAALGNQIIGQGYLHDGDSNKGKSSLVFTASISQAGQYDIFLYAPAAGNRSTRVPVAISRNGIETKKVFVNERAGTGKTALGSYRFSEGDSVTVTVSNDETKGHVVADAVQLLVHP